MIDNKERVDVTQEMYPLIPWEHTGNHWIDNDAESDPIKTDNTAVKPSRL